MDKLIDFYSWVSRLQFHAATRETRQAMNATIFQPHFSTKSTNPILVKPSSSTTKYPPVSLPAPSPPLIRLRIVCTNGNDTGGNSNTSSNEAAATPVPPRIKPPETVEVRFRRRSRRRKQMREEGFGEGNPMKAQAPTPAPAPKKWEDMTLTEKAIELYVGEKGLLFWLNKFAYASIFIVIGAWIVFRFVGPALNLYQLDSPPLAPTSLFKGS